MYFNVAFAFDAKLYSAESQDRAADAAWDYHTFVYIEHLMHGENEYTEEYGNLCKRIKISLEDYDKIVKLITKENH